ncbi:PIH1 domain-containing protein 1 [Nowakowskiella sp. JEL0407]|nr:PIH1 domain-containing protein 1 [Nowakowskiella sp. JEL0407]
MVKEDKSTDDDFLKSISQQLANNPQLAASLASLDSDSPPTAEELALIQEFAQQTNSTSLSELLDTSLKISNLPPPSSLPSTKDQYVISPQPGFVVKTIVENESKIIKKGGKIFVNLAYSEDIPPPPLLSDEEIREAITAEDVGAYKIPLSLADVRYDVDKAGNKCAVFDICINDQPMRKALKDFDFKLFLIEISLEWIEEKHSLSLSREFTTPKMKSKGQLTTHIIKRAKKPTISEIPTKSEAKKAPPPLPLNRTKEIEKKKSESSFVTKNMNPVVSNVSVVKPEFKVEEMESGLKILIELPGVRTTAPAILEIEKERLFFKMEIPNQNSEYNLTIPFSKKIKVAKNNSATDAVAKYDRKNCVLEVLVWFQ